MLTNKDISKLEKKFATKKDLKNHPTNDYLRKLTDELIEFITISNEATKKEIIDELGGQIKQLAKEVSSVLTNHEGRIRVLEKHSDLN